MRLSFIGLFETSFLYIGLFCLKNYVHEKLSLLEKKLKYFYLEWIRRDYKKNWNDDEDTGALDHQWNLFNLITSKTSDVRHHRFLLRLVLTGGGTQTIVFDIFCIF